MKKQMLTLLFSIAVYVAASGQTGSITGKWKTIDDKDGSAKSIVHIFKATNGKYYGKIEHLFKNPDKTCTECEGTDKNKPLTGMIIIKDMIEKDGNLTDGTILDPNNGKMYRCHISFDKTSGKLEVRGSLDKLGIIGRTQTWIKNN